MLVTLGILEIVCLDPMIEETFFLSIYVLEVTPQPLLNIFTKFSSYLRFEG